MVHLIHVDSNKNYQIEVFSNAGKSVLKTFGNKVDIAQIQNGIYFVKLADENTGNVISYKVIKKD